MNKKILSKLLIIAFIIQLFTPVAMVSHSVITERNIVKKGTEYRFAVEPVYAYEGKIELSVADHYRDLTKYSLYYGGEIYGRIGVLPNGFAYIEELVDTKPREGDYLVSRSDNYWRFPISDYETDENVAANVSEYIRENRNKSGFNNGRESLFDDEFYLSVNVYKGKIHVNGLYINGVAVEEFFK